MRNIPVAEIDHLNCDVLPIATDYAQGYLLPTHRHRRAQLLHAEAGVMQVHVEDTVWTVPVAQAVLIPADTDHEVRFDATTTLSLYIEPGAVPWWPPAAMVIQVGSLLRALLVAAADLEAPYPSHGRSHHLTRLILHGLAEAAPIAVDLYLPTDPTLRALCLDYLAMPTLEVTNAAWAAAARMSLRSLDRQFRTATGASPAQWRTRARMLAAIRLLPHKNVTETAGLLGYASPSAFTTAFTHQFGTAPSHYSAHSTRP